MLRLQSSKGSRCWTEPLVAKIHGFASYSEHRLWSEFELLFFPQLFSNAFHLRISSLKMHDMCMNLDAGLCLGSWLTRLFLVTSPCYVSAYLPTYP